MADFCEQCARDHAFEKGDFRNIGEPKDLPLKPGYGFAVICEGCGFVCVDEKGYCMGGPECMEEHHLRPRDETPVQAKAWQDRMRDRQRLTRDQRNAGQPPVRAEKVADDEADDMVDG